MTGPVDEGGVGRAAGAETPEIDGDWFEEWFGEEHLALYPHRDEAEAERVAALVQARVRVAPGEAVLDLASGSGRHQRALAERWWTVGLDLSPSLLRVARRADRDAPLVRADMRELPFAPESFAMVVNLFTSFGYFHEDAEHRRVLGEVARVTRRGGWFVLDFLHAAHVRRALVRRERRRIGSRDVEQIREITDDGRFVVKTITLHDIGRTFIERVRLFEPEELERMIEESGFDVESRAGSYAGAPLDARATRAILFGCRR